MFTDPIFLIAITGILICLLLWAREAIKLETDSEDVEIPNQGILSKIGFFLGLVILYRVYVNAGDLSIILLLATIISFIIKFKSLYTSENFLFILSISFFDIFYYFQSFFNFIIIIYILNLKIINKL